MPSIESIIKKAPLKMLQEATKGKRPTKWTCERCGGKSRESSLRCEASCGLGVQSQAGDGPKVWDMAKAELKRRKDLEKAKKETK